MYGKNYVEEEPVIKAPNGIYEVVIDRVAEEVVSGWNTLSVYFHYKDGILRKPSVVRLFDIVDETNEKQLHAWRQKITAFRRCFKLVGEFNDASYLTWRGKTGTVRIAENMNHYAEVVEFLYN